MNIVTGIVSQDDRQQYKIQDTSQVRLKHSMMELRRRQGNAGQAFRLEAVNNLNTSLRFPRVVCVCVWGGQVWVCVQCRTRGTSQNLLVVGVRLFSLRYSY